MILGVCQICNRKGFMLDNTIDAGYLVQHHMNLSHTDTCEGSGIPPKYTYTQEAKTDYKESPLIQAEEPRPKKSGEFGTLGDLMKNANKKKQKR